MSKKIARYFQIRKYAFLNILKGDQQKNCARHFKMCMYAFF